MARVFNDVLSIRDHLHKLMIDNTEETELIEACKTFIKYGYGVDNLRFDIENFIMFNELDPVYEDLLLNMLDYLYGWCPEHMKIE